MVATAEADSLGQAVYVVLKLEMSDGSKATKQAASDRKARPPKLPAAAWTDSSETSESTEAK